VSTVSAVELDAIARGLARERFDDYAARGLGRAYQEYVGRRRRSIAPVSLVVDGRPYPSIYAVIADPEAKFATGEVRLDRPAASAADWEFLTPFERVVFHEDGSADLHPPGGAPPRRAIARVLLREHFLVRSRAEDAGEVPGVSWPRIPSLVGTLQQGIAICRAGSVLPFEVALLGYLAEERVRFEIDTVHSMLLADPRAGRLAASRRVGRTPRLAWGLDRRIGRGHLSLLATRSLEVLLESNGLTGIDLAHIFGGVREMVDSALQALVQQHYATFDPRTRIYRARLEAFLPATTSRAAPAPAPVRPELRTGVQELIAAADARAVCPLCGKPLTPGPQTLLCDDCARKVGLP
jgi:hypothetical protein